MIRTKRLIMMICTSTTKKTKYQTEYLLTCFIVSNITRYQFSPVEH